jgi:hypothetical protein
MADDIAPDALLLLDGFQYRHRRPVSHFASSTDEKISIITVYCSNSRKFRFVTFVLDQTLSTVESTTTSLLSVTFAHRV